MTRAGTSIRSRPLGWGPGYVLVLGLAVSIVGAIALGPVSIPLETTWTVLVTKIWPGDPASAAATGSHATIVWELRFPRVLLAALVGAGLSAVGCALQALVRNPLADPYLLGVSSGASVGAAAVIAAGWLSILGAWSLSVAACLGAFCALGGVFLLARQGGRLPVARLLLAGIALSAILSAATSFILFLAPRGSGVSRVVFWIMGSLSGAQWSSLPGPAAVVMVGGTWLYSRSRSMNLLLMGDVPAGAMGLRVDRFRGWLLVTSTIMTGVLVAVSGVIGFVGLMVPHAVRMVVGPDHRRLLPFSCLAGAIFLIWVDVLARLIVAPEELPIGILTALLGGPFFVVLMRQRDYSFGTSQS